MSSDAGVDIRIKKGGDEEFVCVQICLITSKTRKISKEIRKMLGW